MIAISLLSTFLVLLAQPGRAADVASDLDALRLDQVQLIGTHNSYKLEADDGIDHVMLKTGYREDERFGAEELKYRLAYHHLPLDVQFDLGVRSIELDVHADPQGGLYAEPGGYQAMAKFGIAPNTPYDPQGLMRKPGFKVLHVPDWDFLSTCPTLALCLETILEWSDRHRDHFPIIIRIDAKQNSMPVIADAYPPTIVPEYDASLWQALERDLRDVFPPDRTFTPTDYIDQWPTIAELRGKLIFILYGGRAYVDRYRAAIGAERLMFTYSEPAGGARITSIPSKQNPRTYTVPTGTLLFASAETYNTREARENDITRRDSVFASPANIIVSDYVVPDPRFSTYRVRFPDATFIRPHPTRSTD